MSDPLQAKAFLALSPEEQATEIARRMPRFATVPKEEQQAYLQSLREELQGRPPTGREPTVLKPSVSGYLGAKAKERAGDIGATVAAGVIPGGPVVRPALQRVAPLVSTPLRRFGSRLLAAEAGHDVGQAATGQTVSPGYGLASQLVGEGIARGVGTVLSPATYRAFGDRVAKQTAAWLKANVPAWAEVPASAKGLYEIVHRTGQRHLSQTFETAMRRIKGAVPETLIVHPREVREVAGRLDLSDAPRNARALIDELPALRKAGGRPYHEALKALAKELPEGLAPELDAARSEYRIGAGFLEFGQKGKFLHGERFDPVTAQQALDRFGKSLFGRSMDELAGIIRGPGAEPIKAVKHHPFLQRIEGSLAGAGIGATMGLPHAIGGAAGGLAAASMLPRTTYKNVPLTPLMGLASRIAPTATAELAREGTRDVGLPPEKIWPLKVGGP